MASAGPSSVPSTTPAPSSAWSRLVQITRTASEGPRSKAVEPSSQLNRSLSSGTHTVSSTAAAKKRRPVGSPPARSVTKYLAPEPNDQPKMSPGKPKRHTCCSLKNGNNECITACPCRVDNVDCVASQEPGDSTRRFLSRSGRQLPTTTEDSNQDPVPPRPRKTLRRGPSHRVRNLSPRVDGLETKRKETSTHLGEQVTSRDSEEEAETADDLAFAASAPCGSAGLEDHDTVVKIVLEPAQAPDECSSSGIGPTLHEGDQNSVNKTPVPKRDSSSSASTDESIQLATPSSSPTTQTESKANEPPVEPSKPRGPASAPKTKRRLTLHGDSYEKQSAQKKRKTAPKRKDGVQTTLSLAIGSSAGMRECKLCDTVYNPFHPEDVKVHTKRHAIAVKRERRSEEISGLTGSSLVD